MAALNISILAFANIVAVATFSVYGIRLFHYMWTGSWLLTDISGYWKRNYSGCCVSLSTSFPDTTVGVCMSDATLLPQLLTLQIQAPNIFTKLTKAVVSLKRLNDFLHKPELERIVSWWFRDPCNVLILLRNEHIPLNPKLISLLSRLHILRLISRTRLKVSIFILTRAA